MDVAKNVLLRVALIVLIAWSLRYLHSTVFSLWAASGPPTEVPQAWLHRALVHFGYSVALSAAAVFVFQFLKPRSKRKRSHYVCFAIVVLAVGYPLVKEFFLSDACLDSGGRWSQRHFNCQR